MTAVPVGASKGPVSQGVVVEGPNCDICLLAFNGDVDVIKRMLPSTQGIILSLRFNLWCRDIEDPLPKNCIFSSF